VKVPGGWSYPFGQVRRNSEATSSRFPSLSVARAPGTISPSNRYGWWCSTKPVHD